VPLSSRSTSTRLSWSRSRPRRPAGG
jgi:hypothetical protein